MKKEKCAKTIEPDLSSHVKRIQYYKGTYIDPTLGRAGSITHVGRFRVKKSVFDTTPL